jgi:hypothetical protein
MASKSALAAGTCIAAITLGSSVAAASETRTTQGAIERVSLTDGTVQVNETVFLIGRDAAQQLQALRLTGRSFDAVIEASIDGSGRLTATNISVVAAPVVMSSQSALSAQSLADETSTAGIVGSGNAGIVGSGNAGIVGSGNAGIVGSGNAGIVGSGNAGIVGSGNAGIVGSGNAGIVGSGNAGIVGSGNAGIVGSGNAGIVGSGNAGIVGSGNASR